MKSRTTWKPPPIFGGKKKCSSGGIRNSEKSFAVEEFALREKPVAVITKGDMIKDKSSVTRMGKLHSTAWKPPPVFVSQPSTSATKVEEEKDQVFEDAAKEDLEKFSPIDILCDINRDEALTIVATPNENGRDETRDDFVAIPHEYQKKLQKNVVETFQPFRDNITRYVANRLKTTNIDDFDVQLSEDSSCATIDYVGDGENSTKVLVTSTEDNCIGDNYTVPIMEVPQKSIADRELFAFWEGVRMSVHASIQASDISRRQLSRRPSESFPSTLLPPHIAQAPRKYRSFKSVSISDTEQESQISDLTHARDAATIEEKWDESPPRPTNASRFLSIPPILHNIDSPVNDTARQRVNQDSFEHESEKIKKLMIELEEAEKYQRKLEKQLKKAGVVIAEDIPYDVAKQKVSEIASKMSQLHNDSRGSSGDGEKNNDTEAEYFKLELEMEKYVSALEVTDEWIEEQAEEERKWEQVMEDDNKTALAMVLRHMPVDVRNRSELQLMEIPTPNGKFLPRSIARKFKRTNCLQLLRTDPMKLIAWHRSMFESVSVSGLTLTERRALHQHLKPVGAYWNERSTGGGDKMLERKLVWFETLKSNFKERLLAYNRHIDAYGPPENHPYAASCGGKGCPMIGKQCPLRADKAIDYSGDYGYPKESVYFDETNQDPIQSNSQVGRKFSERTNSTKENKPLPSKRVHGRGPGRVGLFAEIKGRGIHRGGHSVRGFSGVVQSKSRGITCPGGKNLMDEIKQRGRKEPGRGSSMKEIQSRSGNLERLSPCLDGGTPAGGRGALLAAIQARRSAYTSIRATTFTIEPSALSPL